MLPPLITTLPVGAGVPASVLKLLNARVAPTGPPKVVMVLLLRVSERSAAAVAAVSTVLPKVMLPLPLLNVVLSSKVTGADPNVKLASVLPKVPPRRMAEGAVAVMPLAKVKLSVAWLPKVRVPVLLNTVGAWVLLMLVLLPCKAKL